MKDVDEALRDAVSVFDRLQIDYAVMGGLAVRIHSIPRARWTTAARPAPGRRRSARSRDEVHRGGIPGETESPAVSAS